MKLATTIGDFKRYTKNAAEAVAAFEGTGFKHLDYNFYDVIYKGSPFLTSEWKNEVEDAANTAARLGFDFVQAHSPNYNPLDEAADHEAGMCATLRSIEACAILGIKNIVVHPGYSEKFTYPDGRKVFFEENKKFYRKLIPAMEKYNVNVCIENSAENNMGSRYFFMTGAEMSDFANEVNHPLLHACFDVGHCNMRNTSVYKELLDVGKHLKAVHIQDNFGTYDEHIAPFFGTLDLDACMQALIKINYNGYFTFEAENMLYVSGWPHAKKQSPEVTSGRLGMPSLAIKKQAEALLYNIGKYILEQYSCFEE